MSYLNEFVESLQFLRDFSDDYRVNAQDERTLRNILGELESLHDANYYKEIRNFVRILSQAVLANYREEDVVNKCHAVSQSLWDTYKKNIPTGIEMSVTVGNVIYKGKNLYRLTRDGLREIIAQGPTATGSLDVHVWLTLEEMTVIDLTIVPTLVHRGELPESALEDPILFWREGIESDFEYQPILVDNEFMHRVDRVRYKV